MGERRRKAVEDSFPLSEQTPFRKASLCQGKAEDSLPCKVESSAFQSGGWEREARVHSML
jgi:hypothetical protein